MDNQHLSEETIASFMDAALDSAQRAEADHHLRDCSVCSQTLLSMQGAASALSELPLLEADSDLHRAIRQAVLKKAPPRAVRRWRVVVASSTALLIVAGGSFLASRQNGPITSGKQLAASGPDERQFDSEAEIRKAVTDDPMVKQGLTLYRVKDVGASQDRLLGASRETAPAESESLTGGAGAQYSADQSGVTMTRQFDSITAAVPVDTCLRKVIQSQPFPMMPLVITDATYKKTPAWLFAFAWTTSSDDDARLDRLQIWLVSRSTCSTLSYAQLNP